MMFLRNFNPFNASVKLFHNIFISKFVLLMKKFCFLQQVQIIFKLSMLVKTVKNVYIQAIWCKEEDGSKSELHEFHP